MMVVPILTELCLISVRDGIETGTITNRIDLLPPILRQSILDTVLMHGTIDKPECINVLGSPEFLNGMTSLDLKKGRVDNINYLQRLAESLEASSSTTVDKNGNKTIGNRIEELRISLYWEAYEVNDVVTKFGEIVKIISRCHNLISLDLQLWNHFWDTINFDGYPRDYATSIVNASYSYDDDDTGLLNVSDALQPCLSVLENIRELSIVDRSDHPVLLLSTIYRHHSGIIQFKNLSSLNLYGGEYDMQAWRQLMGHIRETLEHLNVSFIMNRYSNIGLFETVLPFPLPELKTLVINQALHCTIGFVDNLIKCPKLEKVNLMINCRDLGMANWSTLINGINAQLDIKLLINNDIRFQRFDIAFDDLFRFKAVTVLKNKITACSISIRDVPPGALCHLLDECKHLQQIDLSIVSYSPHAQSIFAPFFDSNNKDYASKVRCLEINQDDFLDHSIWKSIFNHFINLRTVDIRNCSNGPSDECLIDWANRGARPEYVIFSYCKNPNLTDNGLIAVLLNSGVNLKNFHVRGCGDGVTKRTWKALFEHCKYVDEISGCPADLKNTFCSLDFYSKPIWFHSRIADMLKKWHTPL